MKPPKTITPHGNEVNTMQINKADSISLTDIFRYKNPIEPKDIVKYWMRNYATIEFLTILKKIIYFTQKTIFIYKTT